MEIDVKHENKRVNIWLTRAESGDAELRKSLEPLYKKWIGYDQEAYPQKRPQPEKAQRWIFAMATIITAVVVLIGVIPMFGYNIDKSMRDEMYIQLNARRAGTAQQINDSYESGDGAE